LKYLQKASTEARRKVVKAHKLKNQAFGFFSDPNMREKSLPISASRDLGS
jgi:hypothetical protein